MKINIGQILRVSRLPGGERASDKEDFLSYLELTKGRHATCADTQKGIWAYKEVSEAGQTFKRVPAILLHNNPFKEGSEITPWVDVVEPEIGYAIYNGDNRKSSQHPFQARGNALLTRIQYFYTNPVLRKFAPPILLFTQREIKGNRTGYREFSGYGIPTRYMLLSQREKMSERYFTNLVVEIALFRLDTENESFDWEWIDRRRDGTLDANNVLKSAPSAWNLWVREGEAAVEKCRRRTARRRVFGKKEQLEYPEADKTLVREVARYYAACPHAFEGLASLVAERVIGHGCKRGWVTKRCADGGVDFVCRVDLGSEFSSVPVVILGQAKCQDSVSGKDLARLVARLQRGWIGVFVTTGVFSKATQQELCEDRYPVVLINGKRMARELRIFMNTEGITLAELLKREREWYETNLQPLEASRILDNVFFGTRIEVNRASEFQGELK